MKEKPSGRAEKRAVRNNTIGIVGKIASTPELVVDAADWKQKIYETKLIRTRPSGTEDTYIMQFTGKAAGNDGDVEKITEEMEVLVIGEIRSEKVYDPEPEENRIKIYILAEAVVINNPPVADQNRVRICGYIYNRPFLKKTNRRTSAGKRIYAASFRVIVKTPTRTSCLPCVCFGREAFYAAKLRNNDYVEICGRFLSRSFKKRIEGREKPFLSQTYEVCVTNLKSNDLQRRKRRKKDEKDNMRIRETGSSEKTGSGT